DLLGRRVAGNEVVEEVRIVVEVSACLFLVVLDVVVAVGIPRLLDLPRPVGVAPPKHVTWRRWQHTCLGHALAVLLLSKLTNELVFLGACTRIRQPRRLNTIILLHRQRLLPLLERGWTSRVTAARASLLRNPVERELLL